MAFIYGIIFPGRCRRHQESQAECKKALENSQPDDFVLLITHNPDVTILQDTALDDLILCGHTHGGHITFFGIWPPALTLSKIVTKYGSRFMTGWAMSRDGIPVYVRNGIGSFALLPRIFARPQIVIITLINGISEPELK